MALFSVLDRCITLLAITAAFLTPLLFSPFGPEQFEFHKQALVVLGAFLALVLLCVRVYRAQELTISRSPLHVFVIAAFLFAIPAAFASQERFSSVFGFGVTSSAALLTLAAGGVWYFVSVSLFTTERALALLRAALVSAVIAAGIAVLSFSGLLVKLLAVFGMTTITIGNGFNTMGTIGNLSYLLGSAAVLSLAGAMSWKGWWQRFAIAALVFFTCFGVFIFFRATWLVLLFIAALLLLFSFIRLRLVLSPTAVVWPAAIAALACVMLFFPPTLPGFSLPLEVAPSFSSSIEISRAAVGERPLFGFGQGQWQQAYMQFFPEQINQTSFWNLRFVFGSSKLTTMPAEIGMVGFGAWVLLLAAVCISGARKLLRARPSEMPVALPAYGVWLAVAAGSAFFAGSVTTDLLFWLTAGMIALGSKWYTTFHYSKSATKIVMVGDGAGVAQNLTQEMGEAEGRQGPELGSVSFDRRSIAGQISLLTVIIACFVAIGIGFFFVERYLAAFSFARGVAHFGAGTHQESLEAFARAARFEQENALYWKTLSEASLQVMLAEIGRSQTGESAQDAASRIQALAAQALVAANRAAAVSPASPNGFAQRARVLSVLVPFGWQDADKELIGAWEGAQRRDPRSPFYLTELGRAQLLVWQEKGRRGVKDEERASHLAKAEQAFGRALALKSDYAPAHYQLATLAQIRGEPEKVIAELDAAVAAAPHDAGLRFERGVLYYNEERLAPAKGEFLQAIGLNPDYANARYFLGLIFDREGKRGEAIEQFEWLKERNPDLELVAKILDNLEAGLPALSGIGEGGGAAGIGLEGAPISEEPKTVPGSGGL